MHGLAFRPFELTRLLWACVPWFALFLSLADSALASFFPGPPEGELLFMSAALIFGWFVKQFVQFCAALWRARWRRCVQRMVLVMFSLPLIRVGIISGDYLHLAMLYPFYRTKIAETNERPLRFPWGDQAVTVLDGIQLRTLVYDDTGKFAAMQPELSDGLCTTHDRLIGNFFIEIVMSFQNVSCSNTPR